MSLNVWNYSTPNWGVVYDELVTITEAANIYKGDTKVTDKKFWTVHGVRHDSYESAEKHAKKIANQNKTDVVIMEAVATATFPIPDIEVKKLTEDTKSK